MPKNNLKNQPRKKIPSPKPLQKRQVSFGVLAVEKNPCLAGRQAKSEFRNPKQIPNQKFQIKNKFLSFRNWNFDIVSNFVLRASKLKSLRLSIALSAIAIGGFIIWQSFIPQSARSKTFTFFQTAWSSVLATAVHNPDGSDQTAITSYASKDAQVSVSSGTDATLAATADSQADSTDVHFNTDGNTKTNTQVNGSGAPANLSLSAATYQSASQDINYNTSTEYTYDSAKVEFSGTAALLKNQGGTQAEITVPQTNLQALYHMNATSGAEANKEGKELALGDLGAGVADANLKALWHLNDTVGKTTGTVADSSTGGANPGTLTNFLSPNGVVSSGKFSTALSFDGANDYVSVVDSSSFSWTSSGMTVEAWVNSANATSVDKRTIVVKSSGAGSYEFMFDIETDGRVRMMVGINGTSIANPAYSSSSITSGAWNHIAGTYDGSNVVAYLNGTPGSPTAKTGTVYNGTGDINIGRYPGGRYFDGSIDEAAVYNTALTQAQITDHYRRGIAEDATMSNSAFEANDGNTYGPVTTAGNTGFNQALSFDGVDDYVSVGRSASLSFVNTDAFSVEAWFQFPTAADLPSAKGYSEIIWIQCDSGGACNSATSPLGRGWLLISSSDNTIRTNIGNANLSSGVIVDLGAWYHAAATYNNGTLKIYVNGVEKNSVSTTYENSTGNYVIGNNKNLIAGTKGLIDEVAIWNMALDAATIAQHAADTDYSPATGATAANTTALSLANITGYTAFAETATKPANTNIKYQLSNDNTNWKFWNGTAWATASLTTDYSDAVAINTNIGSLFAALPGATLYVKAQLNTADGSVRPELDNINIGYTTSVLATYQNPGTYTSAVYDTGQKSDFTTASWTASTTGADTFTHTSDGDFNGTNASTVVSGTGVAAKVRLDDTLNSGNGTETINISGSCTGTGISGTYPNCIITGATYNYASFTIASGATVSVTGVTPLVINSKGDVTINGILSANGGNADSADAGGTGVAGGGNGGNNGAAGIGTGKGLGSGSGGGGGAGFGGNGGKGHNDSCTALSNNGSAYGTASNAGSGGGGGTRGGGGAGGGSITIQTDSNIAIGATGSIRANGGTGGTGESGYYGGGGGSGGGIRLIALENVTNSGTVQAKGGNGYSADAPGGGGGGGRILIQDIDGASSGTYQVNLGSGACTTAGNGVTGAVSYATSSYLSPGTYTSSIKEVGSGTNFSTVSWTETLNGQTIAMKVRSCNDSACSGETAFSSLTQSITSGVTDISTLSGVTDGDGWVQYEATLSTTDTAVTPTLDSVTINTVPLVLEARAGNVATPDGTWTAWSEIGSGATSSSSLGTTFDGNQYIQYRAKFSTANTSYSPSLDDITINYQYYPTSVDYILASSAFDSGDDVNIVNQIQWNETVPSGTDVKFQVRTAPDNSGAPNWTSGSKWCGPTSCAATTGDTDYANSFYNTTPAGETLNSVHTAGSNARWFQYKAFLSTTDSGAAPTLSNITLQYVINAPPSVSAVSTTTQNSSGSSTITYSVYDPEEGNADNILEPYYFYNAGTTLSGALSNGTSGAITLSNAGQGILEKIPTTGYILIDNEVLQYNDSAGGRVVAGAGPYTTSMNITARGKWFGAAGYTTKDASHSNGASVLIPIPDSALSNFTSPALHKACSVAAPCISDPDKNTYSVDWNIRSHFDDIYAASMGVKVMVNDKNAANQVGFGSTTMVVDTKDLSLGANALIIDANADGSADTTSQSRSVQLKLQNIAEDSNLEVQFSNDDINYGIATNSSGIITDSAWKTITIGTYTANTTAWNLLTDNGSKTVYVKIRDIYNNPATPAAQSSNISYNITPEFNSAYDAGTGYTCDGIGADGVCIRQLTVADDAANAGKVAIKYQVRDQDTDESAVAPTAGNVNVFFKYSINGGTDWNYAAGNLSGDGTDNGTNAEGSLQRLVTVASDANNATLDAGWTTHTTYWDAKTALGEGVNYASPDFKIMAFADDGEASLSRNGDPASNLGLASAGTSLDIKNPILTGITFTAKDATDNSATITDSRTVNLETGSITENSSLNFQFANDANNNESADDTWGNTADSAGVVTGGWDTVLPANLPYTKSNWTFNSGNGTKRVFIRIRDQFGNPSEFPASGATATISYNITPEFNSAYDACNGVGADGVCIRQLTISDDAANAGKVEIKYQVRDQDTDESAVSPNAGNVNVRFEYTVNGTDWNPVAGSLTGDGTDNGLTSGMMNRIVDLDAVRTTYKTHTTYWDAKTALGEGAYYASPDFKIRAYVADGEAVNGTSAVLASGGIALDIKNPTTVSVTIDGGATTVSRDVNLILNAADDSNVQIQYANDANNNSTADDAFAPAKTDLNNDGTVVTNSGIYSSAGLASSFTSALWRLNKGVSTTKRVFFKVRDIYGNTTTDDDDINYNQTPEFDISDAVLQTNGTGIAVYQCQITDSSPCDIGKVRIQYRVRDKNRLDGLQNPVTAAIEYLNGTYQAANTLSDAAGTDRTNLAVETVSSDYNTYNPDYKTFTTYWNAKTDFAGYFQNNTAKVKVTINDGETVLNTAWAISDPYTLDTKNPVGVSISINSAAATTASRDVALALAKTDDSSVQMQFANTNETTYGTVTNNDGTVTDAGTYEDFNASKAWRLVKGISATKTVYFKIRDVYGNTASASDTINYNQTPEFDISDAVLQTNGTGIAVYQCQITDSSPCDIGKVRIQYRVRDKNRLDGLQNPVTAAIEYLNGTYQAANTLSDAAGTDRTNLAVETVSSDYNTYNPDYKTFTTYWNAKTDFAGYFQNNTAKVKVTINDGETVLNTVQQESGTYTLDTKDPVAGSTEIIVNAGDPTAILRGITLTLSVTDDSARKAQYSNDNTTFSAGVDNLGIPDSSGSSAAQVTGKYEAYSASKLWYLYTPTLSSDINSSQNTVALSSAASLPNSGWAKIDDERIYYSGVAGNNLTGVSRGQVNTAAAEHTSGAIVEVDGTRTVYFKFFDIYGNGLTVGSSSDSIIYDQTPPGVVLDTAIQDASNTLTNNWRLFLSWRSIEDVSLSADFKQYKIFRCKTTSLGNTSCPTAIAANINNSQTIVPVSSTATLAASGTIDIDGEIMTYTGLGSDESACGAGFTACLTGVTRGANNTQVSAHTSGAQVYSLLANNIASAAVLTSAIADGTTTANITFNHTDGFASSGSVLINSEVITYTSLSGNTLAGIITRGAKQTAAVSHSQGSQVQSLEANLGNNFYTDNFSTTDLGNTTPYQTKYFYFVRSEDLAGNIAPRSSIVDSVPNGSGGRDTIPARVYDGASNCSTNSDTNVGISCPTATIGTNTATIAWKTYNTAGDVNTGDQDQGKGDSFIEYGTVSGNYTKSAGLHNYTTDHSIILTGLAPSTTYYFRVRTRDGIGNIDTTKTDGTGGVSIERSFTTAAVTTAASIAASPAKNRATISWNTTDATNSLIEYWKLADQNSQQTSCSRANATGARTAGQENDAVSSNPGHSVTIAKDLAVATIYCYRVKSKDGYGNDIASSERTFTTLSAPTISNARADSSDIQTNTAIVKWTSSDNTTSFIEFWKTGTSAKKTAGDDTLALIHSVQLPDDLLTNTKYYFQVKSKDDDGNAVGSINGNCTQADANGCFFTTLPPPAPGAITASNVGMNKATIAWTTTGGNDSKTNSIVEYVNYDDYNFSNSSLTVWKTAGNDSQSSSHNVVMPVELAAASKYFVRVSTRDGKGNSVRNIAQASTCPTGDGHGFDSVVSECYFTTKSAPVITQVRVAESLKDKLTITWLTDVAATSIVEYGQNNTYGAIAGDDKTEATNHTVTVDGLTQKTAYHFKVRSFGNTAISQQITKVSNLSETNDFTAETAIDPGDITAPVISDAAIGDTGSASAVITWTTDEPADSQVFYTTSNPATALINSKHEARNSKQIANSNNQNSKHLILGISDLNIVSDFGFRISDFQTKVAYAASTQTINYSLPTTNSVIFNLRLTLSRSLAWTANHMPQLSLIVSFILGAVFAVFAALLLVMANYMRGGWKLRQILKMTPMIVLKDTSSGFCALAASDTHGTWQASFSVYSKHRNVTRKTIGTALALGVLKIFLSTSIPVFLLTQASLAAINYSSTERDTAMNTTHRVELSGLNPATAYWFYVSSADAKGNLTNTLANPLSFTTAAAPDETAPAISNIQITGIADSEAVISWETNESGDSFVEYGVDTGYGSTSGQEEGKTAHSVKLAGLKSKTAYHFKAKSKDISGNTGVSADQTFTTGAGPTNIPPKISAEGPRVEDLKPVSAKILWKTDKPSSSIVAFGKDTNYGTEIGNTEELINEHEVQLIGLDPNTKYRFKVKSADSDGNIGESSDKEFATPEKPIISKVAVSDISLASAIITWETTTSIASEIEYGKTVAYGKSVVDKSLSQTTQHTIKIDELDSGVVYHFRAKGTDQYGSIIQSDDYAFSTIAEPKIAKFAIESVTHGGAEIVWETNTDTDSLVEYQKDGEADAKTAGTTDLAKKHKVAIDKLDDNAKFKVRITGRDSFGNEVKSDYKEFLTLADTEAPKITGVKTESSIPSAGEDQVQVLVSWTTDEPATSLVEYRQGVALGKNYPLKSRLDTNLTTSHLVVLGGFKTSDIYHFRAISKDRAGNEGASVDYTILTPQKKESLLQIIVKNLEETFGFLRKLGK